MTLRAGQRFTYRRTFTEGDLSIFCGVTGDLNPFHIDEAFAREGRFGRRIVPGLLTASMITHIGGLLGFLAGEMHFRFLAPVFVGDTIACTVTIAEVSEHGDARGEGVLVNEDGVEVVHAEFAGRAHHVRLASS